MLTFHVPHNLLSASPPSSIADEPALETAPLAEESAAALSAATPTLEQIEGASADELKQIAKAAGILLPKRARRDKCADILKEQLLGICAADDGHIRTITLTHA